MSDLIEQAILARRLMCDGIQAVYGECGCVSFQLKKLIDSKRIRGRRVIYTQGFFRDNKDQLVDHTWLVVYGYILDATVDQFICGKQTKQPGVYYSHPKFDGKSLRERYVS
jgi:hypothetical protein